ncbi:MAG: hypothetical protein OXF06_00620 [Bacteroidetes bacterium]|nr:hypothetical protein [Bacteroidota bacterium]
MKVGGVETTLHFIAIRFCMLRQLTQQGSLPRPWWPLDEECGPPVYSPVVHKRTNEPVDNLIPPVKELRRTPVFGEDFHCGRVGNYGDCITPISCAGARSINTLKGMEPTDE